MNPDEIIPALRCSDAPAEPDDMGCANKKCKYRDSDGACNIVSMCADAADLLESQQARITELEDQLAESQRGRRAAVADLYTACRRSPCNSGICVKKDCAGNIIPCEFEWRGPQQAGEGETE